MYVCLCHAVTERDISNAVRQGARRVEDLQEKLKVATCCGACADGVEQCLEEHLPSEVCAA
ncbi:MAG: (2Fe-2S)-binding protein [Chromatiales bacterium]